MLPALHPVAPGMKKERRLLTNIIINKDDVHTNILMFKAKNKTIESIIEECKMQNLLIGPGGVNIIRLVTHMDISTEDVHKAIEVLREVLG